MLRIFRRRAAIALCFAALYPVIESRAADPSAAQAAAKMLLDKGWDKTAAARQIADTIDVNSPGLKGNALVLAAHWLVLMHQGRFDDALPSVQAFVKMQSASISGLSGLRAEIWIRTVKQEYREAIIAADRLGQAASPNLPPADNAALAAQEEAIAFLGRFAGFVEGPAENPEQELRTTFERRLIARLTEPQKTQFDQAKSAVLEKFDTFMKEASSASEAATNAADAERQQNLEKLSKEKEQIAEEAGKVEGKEKEVAEEQKKKLADLDQQDAPLRQRLTQSQNDLNAIMPQYNQQKTHIDRLQQQASNEQNPQLRSQRQNDVRRAQDTFNNTTQRQVDNLNLQINQAKQERLGIQQKKNFIQGGAAAQGQQLENLRQGIELDKLKNENKQKRAEKGKAASSGKALALDSKAHAFRTYDDFPFEKLRSKLLGNFR
jgi:hypothetical protein